MANRALRKDARRVVGCVQMQGAEGVKKHASSAYLTLAPGQGLLMHCKPRT